VSCGWPAASTGELPIIGHSWGREYALFLMLFGRQSVYIAVAALVVARSAVFVFWPQSYFDANQAVIGLMAKHLAEARAVPLFMYGQSYVLAIEAWLAAPAFFCCLACPLPR
jgi:hypothetical protein